MYKPQLVRVTASGLRSVRQPFENDFPMRAVL